MEKNFIIVYIAYSQWCTFVRLKNSTMKEIKTKNKVHYENNESIEVQNVWKNGEMINVVLPMPDSLTRQLQPDKDLRRNEIKFERNPFIFEDKEKAVLKIEIPTKTKKKIIGSSDLGVVNVHTGEVEGGNFLWTNKTVDDEQFAKIYLSQISSIYNLTKTGLRALSYVLSKLEPNKDLVYIYYPEMQQYCNWSIRKTCNSGLKELLTAKIIAPSMQPGFWFINPHIVFNGNRLTLVTNYTKKGTNEQTNDLQMLG